MKWSLKTTHARHTNNLNQTLLYIYIYIYISYRYKIKHLYDIQIQKYIAKKKIYTELCTNEIQMACNSYYN